METKSRAPLPSSVQALLPLLELTFAALREVSHANWYPHVTFERRARRTLTLNPQTQRVDENESLGVMIRIFDGRSMHETSSDQLDAEALPHKARELAESVRRNGIAAPTTPAYLPPSWTARLQSRLEPELREQIPAEANPGSWVHFGVQLREPLFGSAQEAMESLRALRDRFLLVGDRLALTDAARDLSFWSLRLNLEEECFAFLDAQTRMTQTLPRNSAMVIAMKGPEHGSVRVGGLGGRETLRLSERDLHEVYDELGKALRAERLTPGRYKLILSPGLTGVFAHEAFGHTQEGDTWARGRSKARELHAQRVRVGNEHATIVNNPAAYTNGEEDFAACGSYFFDEEGWLAEKQLLVEEGWLQPPMTNLASAVRLGVPRTANGKRESWSNAIYARQTNTYFSPGKSTFAELLAQVDYGFLASTCRGGMEDPKGMGIQVGIGYLEEIRNGKLTGRIFHGPNGGAVQMTGYVPDYLNAILGKSKIEAFHAGADKAVEPINIVGGCGKYHKESVVAGCGGTFLLIDQVLLS